MVPRRISRGRCRSWSSTKVYHWSDLWRSVVYCSFLCIILSLQSVVADSVDYGNCSSMAVPNGMVPTSQHGERPELECDLGYHKGDLNPNREVPYYCVNGVLTGNLTCKSLNCSSMTLNNGVLSGSVDGASPTLDCDDGYVPNDITEIPYRCIRGKLIGNQTCIMGSCSSLRIDHGIVPKSLNLTYPTLECDFGYLPNEINSSTVPYFCNGGTLRGNQTCGIIKDYCREPAYENGKIASGNYSLGSNVSVECNIGFQLSTATNRVCAAGDEADGIWSGDQHCRAIDFYCPRLVVDGAATLYLGFRRVESRAIIVCNRSSLFVPPVRPICTIAENGTVYWKDIPMCDVMREPVPEDSSSSVSSGSIAAIAILCIIIVVLSAFLIHRERHMVESSMSRKKSTATLNVENSLHKLRHQGEELCGSLKNSFWHAVSSKGDRVPDNQVWVSQDSKLNEVLDDHGERAKKQDLPASVKLQRQQSAPCMFSTDACVSTTDRAKQIKQALSIKRCHTSVLLLTEKERQLIEIDKDLLPPCAVKKQSGRRVTGTSEQSGDVAMIKAVTSEEEASMKGNIVPVTPPPVVMPKQHAMTETPSAPLLSSPVAMLKNLSTWHKHKKEKDAISKKMNPWSGVNRQPSKNIQDLSRPQSFRKKLTLPHLKGNRQRSKSENPTTKVEDNSVEMSDSQDLYECLGENQRPSGQATIQEDTGTGPEAQEAGEGNGELYECLGENQKANGQPSSKEELPANTKKVMSRRESMTDVPEAFRDVLHYGSLGDCADIGSIYNNSTCSIDTQTLNRKQSALSMTKQGAVKSSNSKTKQIIPCLVDPLGFSQLNNSSLGCSRESLYITAVDNTVSPTHSSASSRLDLPATPVVSSPAPPLPPSARDSNAEPTNGVDSDAERESVYAACSGTEVGRTDSFTDLAMVKKGGSRYCPNPLPFPPGDASMEENAYEMDDEVFKQVVKDSRTKGKLEVKVESKNNAFSRTASRKLKDVMKNSKMFSSSSSAANHNAGQLPSLKQEPNADEEDVYEAL